MATPKNTRTRKGAASLKTERKAAPARTAKAVTRLRPLETIRTEIRKVMDGPLKNQHNRLSALTAEFEAHPEGKIDRAERDAAHQRKAKAEDRARDAERRKREARFPQGINPLTDDSFGQSLHQVQCALAYYNSLAPTDDDGRLTDDQEFGRHLLAKLFESALKTVEEQECFERAETRAEHEAELAKLKGGAP